MPCGWAIERNLLQPPKAPSGSLALGKTRSKSSPGSFRALFLDPDRDALYARINARFDAMLKSSNEKPGDQHRSELPAIALLAYLRRLLDRYASSESHVWAETLLAKASDEELERLVGVTLQVIEEEAKG